MKIYVVKTKTSDEIIDVYHTDDFDDALKTCRTQTNYEIKHNNPYRYWIDEKEVSDDRE